MKSICSNRGSASLVLTVRLPVLSLPLATHSNQGVRFLCVSATRRQTWNNVLKHRAATAAVQSSGSNPLSSDVMEELTTEDLRSIIDKMCLAPDGIVRDQNASGSLAVPTFSKQTAFDWLQHSMGFEPSKAQSVLAQLQRANFVTAVGSDEGSDLSTESSTNIQLACTFDYPKPKQFGTLNTQFRWYGEARAANQVSEDLRRKLLQLYGKHVDEDGKLVDYKALGNDEDFKAFTVAAAELQKVDVFSLSREERLAFFINTYNSLVIHANVVLKPLPTLLGRLRYFDTIKYNIGGFDFSANDIEHGVLRGNAISPTSVGALIGKPQWSFLAPKWFKEGDARLPLAIVPPDPRIHFTLNCGAKSCPAIRVYSERNLEAGLKAATKVFVAGEVSLDPVDNEVIMSKIFKWYKSDFGSSDEDMLQYIVPYMEPSSQKQLQEMLDNKEKKIKLKFKEYDWTINAK